MASNSSRAEIKRGHGSDERPLARVLWAREAHDPKAPALSVEGNCDPDNREIDFKRYYDPAWAQAEYDRVWSKSWLFACREEDIPAVGDRVPLQVGPLSYFVVRSAPDEFKAFFNSCLHRGTMLCSKRESAATIRCPFHGWEWSNDGRLKRIPGHWDFGGITLANGSLPQVRLGRWGGFIFINADRDAPSLESALGLIPEHFRKFAPENRYTAARFRKLVKANWKTSQEAFMEAYHLTTTHPEAVPFNGDAQTQYDVWQNGDCPVGRNAGCSVTPSIHAPPEASVYDAGVMFAQAMHDWHYPDGELPKLDPHGDIRAQVGAWHRAEARRKYGRDLDLPDAIMMDSMLYFMFPHACFWLSESVPFCYQFLPHETDPEKSYFDVRVLLPCTEGQPRPPSTPAVELGPEDSVQNAPGFGFLGYVFDQDMSNFPLVQRGMHAADPANPHSRLGRYQEILIQHWNEVIDRMVSGR